MDQPAHCPGCGEGGRFRGRIPSSSHFAGREVSSTELPPRTLYRCPSCRLLFAHPNPSATELDELYRAGAASHWEAGESPARQDWEIAARWIGELGGSPRVLDVGCANGEFFDLLPSTVQRYGIEINKETADLAASTRGIETVGGHYRDLADSPREFDVITAFDVIEHVANPTEFIEVVAGALAPGGRLIIGTGNADAPSWRLMQGRYWYCNYPEHLAFISPAWTERIAPRLGLSVLRTTALTRFPATASPARELAKNLAYRVLPLAVSRAVKRRVRGGMHAGTPREVSPPTWVGARDHFLVELGRP